MGNPLLQEILQEENRLAFQLTKLAKILEHNAWESTPMEVTRELYPAATFMAQTLSLVEGLQHPHGLRFIRRIHGAFKNPDDMRGLSLELGAATHFIKAGLSVEWQSSGEDKGFDLLVDSNGVAPFEVECKSISSDKGRKIHQREARDFFRLVDLALKEIGHSFEGGISMVLTVENRLPSSYKERINLAKKIASAMNGKRSRLDSENFKIEVKTFDPDRLINIHNAEDVQRRLLVEEITESLNCNSYIRQNRVGDISILTIKSSKDDSFVDAIFETLKDAADKQFSKQRAGVLIVELFGIDSVQMHALAEQDATSSPTSLRVRTSALLDSQTRNHIAQIYFSSRQNFSKRNDASFTSNATTYFFENKSSSFWNTRFTTLFTDG